MPGPDPPPFCIFAPLFIVDLASSRFRFASAALFSASGVGFDHFGMLMFGIATLARWSAMSRLYGAGLLEGESLASNRKADR